MRYWVIRADPATNPFESFIRAGQSGRWWTKKPPKTWDVGDRLFVWASSPQQEIIALAELLKPQSPHADKNGYFYYRVKFVTGVIKTPVPRLLLEHNRVLNKSILLKHGPATSVIRLNDFEGEELYRLVASKNPSAQVWRDISRDGKAGDHVPDVDISGREGSKVLRPHLIVERNRTLVAAKKNSVLAVTGKLECEVCEFDFEQEYGSLGKGFCEVHHLKPLGDGSRAKTTKMEDLIVLCSNCHRMIHRSKRMFRVDELKAALANSGRT